MSVRNLSPVEHDETTSSLARGLFALMQAKQELKSRDKTRQEEENSLIRVNSKLGSYAPDSGVSLNEFSLGATAGKDNLFNSAIVTSGKFSKLLDAHKHESSKKLDADLAAEEQRFNGLLQLIKTRGSVKQGEFHAVDALVDKLAEDLEKQGAISDGAIGSALGNLFYTDQEDGAQGSGKIQQIKNLLFLKTLNAGKKSYREGVSQLEQEPKEERTFKVMLDR